MGVKYCFRFECDNIMCDTYINGIDYLCSDCKSEFKNYIEHNHIIANTDFIIKKELKIFIGIPKDAFTDIGDKSIDDFFEEHTNYF